MANLNAVSRLAAGTRHTVLLSSTIKHTAGNQLAATRWTFTTGRA